MLRLRRRGFLGSFAMAAGIAGDRPGPILPIPSKPIRIVHGYGAGLQPGHDRAGRSRPA